MNDHEYLNEVVVHTMKSAKLCLTNPLANTIFHFSFALELVD